MKPASTIADHAATIILGGAVITVVGVCAWHWSTPEAPPSVAALAATTTPVYAPATRTPPLDYTEIADWHLFGEPAADAPETGEPATDVADIESLDNLPPSAVALQVTGTVTSNAAEGARAVVMDGAGRQTEVAVGDRLPGGIELHAIERTRIVIRRNGVLEAIALPQPNELIPGRNTGPAAKPSPLPSAPDSKLTSYNDK